MENYPEAPVQVWLTENDPLIDEVEVIELPPAWGKKVAPPDSTVPQILNLAFQESPFEAYYGFIGDDVIPPKGQPWWYVLGRATDGVCFVYPEDSIHGTAGAPHFAIGGELVRAVGWLAAPWFHHNFIDTTWYYLAKELGLRRICPDVLFQHLHPLDPKHQKLDDGIYRLGRSHYKEDETRFKHWMNSPDGLRAVSRRAAEKLSAL